MAAASFPSLSQTLTISSNFNPLRHSSLRSFSLQRSRSAKRTFVVRAGEVPLVGNVAPDFEAEVVFDQEFINITAFSDRYGEFEKLNTEILSVSVDSVESIDQINIFSIITIMSFLLLAPSTIFMEGIKFTPTYLEAAGMNVQEILTWSFLAALCNHAYQQGHEITVFGRELR